MAALNDEHQQWELSSGVPLVNGKIYIGTRNQDPVLNPVTIYSDRALSTVLSQPQRTDANGRAENKIFVSGRYSIRVDDEDDVQLYQELDNGEEPASGVTTLSNVQGINAITAEAAPAITSYADKEFYIFSAASTNTGAVTLDAGGGAKGVKKHNDQDLVAGDIEADQRVVVVYNSTDDVFQMPGPASLPILESLLTTRGDTIRRGASAAERLALGTAGQVKESDGTDAAWGDRTKFGTYFSDVSTGSPEEVELSTSIPSWATNILIALVGVSTNGTNHLIVQLGSTTYKTSGYLGSVSNQTGAATDNHSSGFDITSTNTAATVLHGFVHLTKVDSSVNDWVCKSLMGLSDSAATREGGGSVSMSGVVDRVKVRTTSGNTYDAGAMGLQYW